MKLYQIDAFTDTLFGGNPACVVPLTVWPADELLLRITQENAVAETAFFIDRGDHFLLRWFTPEIEMDLCGHATLAAAHAIITILNYPTDKIIFRTLSGELIVTAKKGIYTLDFPSRKPAPAVLPELISQSLGIQPKEVLKARDYVLVYESEADVRNITLNRQLFDQVNLDPGGVVVTAKGDHCDFVSRFFTPQALILEDPVTGSAHCSLIPFWAERLNKKEMQAQQLSARLGKLFCIDQGDRVLISGTARTYSIGEILM
ncbi:PhzF family phenazine biosynthesis protein [Mucilaginibacter ginsenosidivorax]|uniref:PhzF family phenazine biosynthesis protein n=1 Tax=Mucilaginibacter ginsenosidivorax TaxID=862126 RepID=A0A5B8W351_9SPHI|nr:PhzF family phenazine biosynthesis protein [Mucilaginibacter ginsenosidivorax]QEC77372.1 PhzF family phenazine biosynthesis protein [Mucilaginibacter ginsenosidivorax]